jgi:hypothetical protein
MRVAIAVGTAWAKFQPVEVPADDLAEKGPLSYAPEAAGMIWSPIPGPATLAPAWLCDL